MNEFTAHCASSGAGLHQFFLESSRSYAQASGEEHLADQVKPFSNARPLWDILASRARIQVDREPNPVGAKEAVFYGVHTGHPRFSTSKCKATQMITVERTSWFQKGFVDTCCRLDVARRCFTV
jgi:hypothetical protein